MKKFEFDVCNLIAATIVKVDMVLYKTFGFVSSFRRDAWAYQGKKLQEKLDREHHHRDWTNRILGYDYTTKKALEIYYRDEVYLMDW